MSAAPDNAPPTAPNAAVVAIGVRRTEACAVVTLNRPERRNAMSLAMWHELPRIFRALDADDAVRAVILRGAAGHFSAGADISEFAEVRATAEQASVYEMAIDACCEAIFAAQKPTIAAIDGFCMGGGCHLAMSCDFRFASRNAVFGIPAARLSIVYGVGGMQKLLNLVGLANAKRILYAAERFDAAEALRIGFADRIEVDPLAAAQAFAAVMARNAPLTIAGSKTILNALAAGMGQLDAAAASRVIERAVGSRDYQEGREAFVEKRQPVFRGR